MSQPSVLVAEDEFIVATDLCDTVEEAGFRVEGPHADVRSALRSIENHMPDLAILDVRLGEEEVFPLAERLMDRHVPVIFHSGQFDPSEIKLRYPGAIACAKPCPPSRMLEMVQDALHAA